MKDGNLYEIQTFTEKRAWKLNELHQAGRQSMQVYVLGNVKGRFFGGSSLLQFFFSEGKKLSSAESRQGRGCGGLKSEKMRNTCLGE